MITNEAFDELIRTAPERFGRPALARLEEETLDRIEKVVGNERDRFAVAWSGGKDSLVLRDLALRAGVRRVFWCKTRLEWPVFERWVATSGPDTLETIYTGQDLAWLLRHPTFLFPSVPVVRWMKVVQWTGQKRFFAREDLRMVLLGRRNADGNICGPKGVLRNKNGYVSFSPLYLWPHDAILAYIAKHGLALPPSYYWPPAAERRDHPDGFADNQGPWPKRRCYDQRHGWRDVHRIDPELLMEVAPLFPSGRDYLERLR